MDRPLYFYNGLSLLTAAAQRCGLILEKKYIAHLIYKKKS